jgi:leader peptidase (prepilin peptidase)/N-methyltransferase
MWLAAVLGVGIGLVLNMCADRLPPFVAANPFDPRRVARWSALLLISSGLFAHLQSMYGWNSVFVVRATYCSLLLLIAVIDLEHSLIPNALVGFGLLLALGFNVLYATPGLAAALWGAAIGGGIFALLAMARRNALGMGDVKLAFLIGMMTGFPGVLQALTLGVILGGLAAGLLLLTRVRRAKQYMPYAPYLVAGSMATLLYGQGITNWYVNLVGSGG